MFKAGLYRYFDLPWLPVMDMTSRFSMSNATKARILLLGVFLAMLAGMVGKTYYDHITKSNQNLGVSQFLIPVIVSPMIFGVVFSFIKNTEPIPALILGFQNGFFWQDIFSGIKIPKD